MKFIISRKDALLLESILSFVATQGFYTEEQTLDLINEEGQERAASIIRHDKIDAERLRQSLRTAIMEEFGE